MTARGTLITSSLFEYRRSDGCEVLSHCGFDLHWELLWCTCESACSHRGKRPAMQGSPCSVSSVIFFVLFVIESGAIGIASFC